MLLVKCALMFAVLYHGYFYDSVDFNVVIYMCENISICNEFYIVFKGSEKKS